ncbi:hypothetical protein IA854_13775 [Listeria seeligeri]|uniref:hypothetical protein n=1 Tax=Listeria seeligeri TaxID=1640 RepID=UPI00162A6AF1|nr:hypothetical protein [Listeria seeligeri]MBC1990399.1 hypothetical protein [Listeria seeligeri]MBF2375212.1 hypothetical protein [Listeria seeligeri]UCK61883.1 hypothetical protein pLIS51_00391c [Listeria seeligeri]
MQKNRQKWINQIKRNVLKVPPEKKRKRYKVFHVSHQISSVCLFFLVVIANFYFLLEGLRHIPELTYIAGGEEISIEPDFWLHVGLSYVVLLLVVIFYGMLETKRDRRALWGFLAGASMPIFLVGLGSSFLLNNLLYTVYLWVGSGLVLLIYVCKALKKITKWSLNQEKTYEAISKEETKKD